MLNLLSCSCSCPLSSLLPLSSLPPFLPAPSPRQVLDITDDDLGNLITAGLRNVAAACLELNYPTIASVRRRPLLGLLMLRCADAAAGLRPIRGTAPHLPACLPGIPRGCPFCHPLTSMPSTACCPAPALTPQACHADVHLPPCPPRPPLPQVPHSLINGYKNVLAIAVETDYSFPQAEKVRHGGLAPWNGMPRCPAAAGFAA